MGDTEELANALRDAARQAGLAVAEVEGLHLLSGGASKEMWAFDLIA
ncbi:MAG: phosphotransferase family protein, partial [Sphingomonadales bacterium]